MIFFLSLMGSVVLILTTEFALALDGVGVAIAAFSDVFGGEVDARGDLRLDTLGVTRLQGGRLPQRHLLAAWRVLDTAVYTWKNKGK